ncbi:MAG: T9SS type A sorting domain-containing protein [Cyclobacteriaceae bacterium]
MLLLIYFASTSTVSAQSDFQVTDIEYFFDNDPGFGSGTGIDISADTIININQLLSTSGLSNGFHTLFMRARFVDPLEIYNTLDTGVNNVYPDTIIDYSLRSAGLWGITESRVFYVDQSEVFEVSQIDTVEYFFDIDPGFGQGFIIDSFTPDSLVNLVENLSTSSLSIGFHTLYMRAKISNGRWGMSESRLLYVDAAGADQIIEVDSLEYFFDVDPGYTNGNIIDGFTAGTLINLNETLSTSGLAVGFHTLFLRGKAVGGDWGMSESRLLYVDAAGADQIIEVDSMEYFFDVDPGYANGNIIDGFTVGALVNLNETLNTSGLAVGFHTLFLRGKAVGGDWGMTESRLLYVDPSGADVIQQIDSLEYFFDVDPGVGQGTIIDSFSAAESLNLNETLSASGLSQGFHILYLRGKTQGGDWGAYESRLMYVDHANVGEPQLVQQMEYFFDTDPGYGQGIPINDFTVSNQINITDTLQVDTLSGGLHTFYLRAQTQNGQWGPVEGRTFTFEPDTIAPVISINFLATNINSPGITGTTSEGLSSLSITVNGQEVTDISMDSLSWSIAQGVIDPLADGVYDLSASAVDSFDNSGVDITINELIIDTQRPVSTVFRVVSNDNTPRITGTVTEHASIILSIADSLYEAALLPGDTSWELADNLISPLADGSYDLIITAIDSIGNTGTDTVLNALKIDATAPVVGVDLITTSVTSPQLSGDISDPSATVMIQLGDSTYAPIVNDTAWIISAGTIPDLAIGFYEIGATATDSVGNIGEDTSIFELTIIAPTVVEPTLDYRFIDSLALVGIYNSAIGSQWARSDNWLTGSIDTWYGVSVSEGRVTAIDLSGNMLSGEIHLTSSSALDALTNLNLSNNNLVGLVIDSISVASISVINNLMNFNGVAVLIANQPTASYSPQKIQLSKKRILAELGQTVVIDRMIGGATAYTWFRNDTVIAGSSAIQEVIIDGFADEGVFHVEATSSAVSGLTIASSKVNLRVSSLERDSRSLLTIKDSLSLDVNWEGVASTSWEGVGIINNRVARLDLSNKNIEGHLPEEILDLADLVYLDISNNAIDLIPDMTEMPKLDTLMMSNNKLDFASIVPNRSIVEVDFEGQALIEMPAADTLPKDSQVILSVNTGRSDELNFNWFWRGVTLNAAENDMGEGANAYEINGLTYENMGAYRAVVTSDSIPDFKLETEVQGVYAFGSIDFYPSFFYADGEQDFIEDGESYLFKITASGPYDTVGFEPVMNDHVFFDSVVLGDYLLYTRTDPDFTMTKGDDEVQFIPTYFESVLEWDSADVLMLREFLTDTVEMIRIPPPLPPDPEGGIIGMIVESDFEDDVDPQGRLDSRRRVKKAGCSLRRRTTGGGGRTEEDVWELVVYKETDDNGRVEFGDLPDGFYRLNIQYPGVPMDPNSFVEFEISDEEDGDGYELAATVTEEGIVVEVIEELGVYRPYFKDLEVYPIPTDGDLNIRYRRLLSKNVMLELLNLSGQVIIRQPLSHGRNQSLSLKTDQIEDGIYVLNFYDETELKTKIASYKIVITQ